MKKLLFVALSICAFNCAKSQNLTYTPFLRGTHSQNQQQYHPQQQVQKLRATAYHVDYNGDYGFEQNGVTALEKTYANTPSMELAQMTGIGTTKSSLSGWEYIARIELFRYNGFTNILSHECTVELYVKPVENKCFYKIKYQTFTYLVTPNPTYDPRSNIACQRCQYIVHIGQYTYYIKSI